MIPFTILAAALFSILAAAARPGVAFGLVIASALLWTEYLRIPMGLAQMSAPRIVALVVVTRFLINNRVRRVRWQAIDLAALLLWIWQVLAFLAAGADETRINTAIGNFFDTILMFVLARTAILSMADVRDAVKPIAFTAFAMAAVGVVEAVTSRSPYDRMFAHHAWRVFFKEAEYRLGFLRAKGSASHPINFGMAMMLMAGLLWSTRGVGRRRSALGAGAALVAAMTSLSSGPLIAIMLTLICNALFYARRLIKPLLACLVLVAIFLELASNRHFYELVDYLAFNTGTAWYRTRLLEVGVGMLHEYWLFGYGGEPPNHWAQQIDTRGHVDMVNNYLIVATNSGLLGLFLYLAVQILALRGVVRAFGRADMPGKMYTYGLGATLVALMLGSMSVGLFGPSLLLSWMLMGLMADPPVQAPRPIAGATPAPRHASMHPWSRVL